MYKDYASACVLSTFGVTESELEGIKALANDFGAEVSYAENNGEGRLTIAKKAVDDQAVARILKLTERLVEGKIYADEDISLARKLVNVLSQEGKLLAVAESLTGGMLASSICGVEGASKVFYEGVITYNNAAKVRRLHVPAGLIEEKTAVSEEVCNAMLAGVLANKEIDYAIVTTGYASGMDDLNGRVYVGIGGRCGSSVAELNLSGERNDIRAMTVNTALFNMINMLTKGKRS